MVPQRIHLSENTLKQGWRLLCLRVEALRRKAQLAYAHGLKREDARGPLRDFLEREQKRNPASELRLSGKELWVFARDSGEQLTVITLAVLSKRMREHLQATPEQQALLAQEAYRGPAFVWTYVPDERVALHTQRTACAGVKAGHER